MGREKVTAFRAALTQAGLAPGSVAMVHADLGRLGAGGKAMPAEEALTTLLDLLGPAGTLVVPTYTFSFCRREEYDPAATPTLGGPWSPSADFLEAARHLPGARRSIDPIHSVVAIGPDAARLVDDVPATCFGSGSVFARLREVDARIVMLGLPLEEATLRHHVEELEEVPFRFRKLFTGTTRVEGQARRAGWVYSVRILAEEGHPEGSRLEALARERGAMREVPLGRDAVRLIGARDLCDLTSELVRRDPWATARGPAGNPDLLERARVGAPMPAVALPAGADMPTMLAALGPVTRDIVSDGYDAALDALATQVPMTVHAYPSGMEAWSWIVPEKWACHEARLETLDGRVLFSTRDHPLHVVSYSLPIDRVVGREELLRHLHVHPRLPDAVPFIFKYYDRDWGLCCTRRQRDALTDDAYRVVIRSDFSFGHLKVGEVVVPGRSGREVVLCAHLCHPAMVNDDLTGVVVGIEVMRRLLAGPAPRHTVRLLIVPETIGSIAHLSRHMAQVPVMVGGLFLEMLGREHPHALQQSLTGTAVVDEVFGQVLREADTSGWMAGFRELAGNDERQFNAPGMRVPMLALTRQLPPDDPDFPYREYHSSEDTAEHVPPAALEESCGLVLKMLRALDEARVPVLRQPGEVFCSRYGIHVDAFDDPEGHRALFDVLFLVDGTRTVAGIARACGIPVESVERILAQLDRHDLLDWW